jgi:hypothetical protein
MGEMMERTRPAEVVRTGMTLIGQINADFMLPSFVKAKQQDV